MYTEQNILCFITAADVLNISQAAEILYMSRQAVSQQIKNLETSLNATLFERVNNKLTLTAAGKAYLCEFTAFQKKISVLNTKFYAPDEGTLPIRIGIMETLRPWKQITHFRKYCEEHGLSPEIQYSVFSPNGLVEGLTEHSLDIALSMPLPVMNQHSKFGSFLYAYIPQRLFIQKSHPLLTGNMDDSTLADKALALLPVALFGKNIPEGPRSELFQQNWKQNQRFIHSVKPYSNIESAALACENGECIILAPETSRFMDDRYLVSFSLNTDIDYYCIWNKTYDNPCVKLFIERMVKYNQENLYDKFSELQHTIW